MGRQMCKGRSPELGLTRDWPATHPLEVYYAIFLIETESLYGLLTLVWHFSNLCWQKTELWYHPPRTYLVPGSGCSLVRLKLLASGDQHKEAFSWWTLKAKETSAVEVTKAQHAGKPGQQKDLAETLRVMIQGKTSGWWGPRPYGWKKSRLTKSLNSLPQSLVFLFPQAPVNLGGAAENWQELLPMSWRLHYLLCLCNYCPVGEVLLSLISFGARSDNDVGTDEAFSSFHNKIMKVVPQHDFSHCSLALYPSCPLLAY